MRISCISFLSAGLALSASALPVEEADLIDCAAENTAGAVFIHSMIELRGPNAFLEDLSERQQIKATEFILTAEGKQVERFHPEPVPDNVAAEINFQLDTQTGERLEALGALLDQGKTELLVKRLTAAPECGEG